MEQAPSSQPPSDGGQIVDFDEALLDACPQDRFDAVMAEARLLAEAFAPGAGAGGIEPLAQELQSGVRDLEYGRAHARLLAAALHRLARQASDQEQGRTAS
jgi:hypothetical protein